DGTHMVSILIGDDDTTLKTARILEEEGVWVGPAVSPGVPMGKSLLRTCFPPTLSDEEFRLAINAFETASKKVPQALFHQGADHEG
ncbi:MAG: hypothetical protein MI747_06930, partial [Desulfobacterales bacterium]|nr:hypothetical protein [Desulfobacterales bacterium]